MSWLKVGYAVFEYVLLPWLRARRKEKEAKKLEQVASAVISGIEAYKNTNDKSDIKAVIKNVAVATGIETKLQELVRKYTK